MIVIDNAVLRWRLLAANAVAPDEQIVTAMHVNASLLAIVILA